MVRRRTLNLPALGLALLSTEALASEGVLEEIVVTANRRESALMATPTAVTAFDAGQRDRLGIYSRLDLERHTPSLTISERKISIRGVGRPNNALGSDPGVGIYWDGVYRTENGIFNYAQYLDIERIEVLRGPQGTLYGRNSVGGAINFVSVQPAATWGGKLVAGLGNDESSVLQGLASGPITDDLSVLLAVSQVRSDGHIENTHTGASLAQQDVRYGSLALRHVATDRWVNTLKLFASGADHHPNPGMILEPFQRDYIQPVNDRDTGELLNFPGMFPKQNFANMRQGLAIENPALRDPDRLSVDFDPREDANVRGATLTSDYEANDYRLRYIGGYSNYDYHWAIDADHSVAADSGLDWRELKFFGVPVSAFTGYTVTPSDMIYTIDQSVSFHSHEVQVLSELNGPVNVIAGLYYYRSDERQRVAYLERNEALMDTYRFFGGFINAPVSDDNELFRGDADLITTATAVYGQLEWQLSERSTLTLGLRYSNDDKDGGDTTFVQYVGDPLNPRVSRSIEDDWSETTWRIGLDHSLSDQHFLYAFLATGYRSGGFNFQKPTDSPRVDVVAPEQLLSYEVGYKGSLWDGRSQLRLAAFYYDYQDLQVLRDEVINGIGLKTFDNAERASAYGIEAEASARPLPGLRLNGSYSWNHTGYDEFVSFDSNACAIGPLAEGLSQDPLCSQPLDLSGNQFPLTPEHKLSLNLTLLGRLAQRDWSATVSYLYTGGQWGSQFNHRTLDRVDGFDQWDLRLTLGATDAGWQWIAFANNVTDERAVVSRERPSTVTHNAISGVQNPRSYGLRLHYRF